MTNTSRKNIMQDIAWRARMNFQNNTVPRPLLCRLYQEYNPDIDNMKDYLDQSLKSFPSYCCGLASVYLKELFQTGEIVRGRYLNEHHTFLLLDKQVIDITADQFGGPLVYVGKLKKPWSLR